MDSARRGGAVGRGQERGTTSAGSPVGSGGSVRSGKSAPAESAITTSTPWFRDSSTDSDSSSPDRKSTRLNSSHVSISYAVFCLKKKKTKRYTPTTRQANNVYYKRAPH